MAKRGRADPYKGFNFQVVIESVVVALAGFALVRKLMPAVAAKYRKPKDYVSEVPSGSRPIEGVGTSIATMPRSAPNPKKRRAASRPASRKATGRKGGGGAKRR